MEEQCSPLSWRYCYQEEGIEELRHFYRTLELETTILSAKEEIERKEFELIHLKDVLNRTIKERNEARTQCQNQMLEKLILQQQLHKQQQQQQEEAAALLSGASSSEDESKPAGYDSNKHFSSSDCNKSIVLSPVLKDPIPQQPLSTQQLPQVALNLAAEMPLPEKGKLLKAVMEAGPLLQNLLLAGPLPQWQHPPPQLDSIEIPPVAISSPSPRLPNHHQNPFNSPTSCLSKRRGLEFSELGSNSPPNTKYQKIALH